MITVLLTAVALAIPSGFTEARSLEPAASYVAGKPVAVACPQTQADWDAYVESAYGTTDIGGYAPVGGSVVTVSLKVCRYAEMQLTKAGSAPLLQLGAALQILVHEANHARGESDEGQADCGAVHRVPGVATRFFRVKAGKQLRALMTAVWQFRATSAPQLRTVC